MLLYLMAFVGGVLTIVSPCILPVLPFVFSRADQPFRRSGLPLLLGMAATFALVAGLATYAGGWVVRANQVGRVVALVVFALLGLALLFPSLSLFLTQPLARLGARIQGPGVESRASGYRPLAPVGCFDRPPVGSLRRTDPRTDPDRRGGTGPQRSHHADYWSPSRPEPRSRLH